MQKKSSIVQRQDIGIIASSRLLSELIDGLDDELASSRVMQIVDMLILAANVPTERSAI
jgi:hypothetical protein